MVSPVLIFSRQKNHNRYHMLFQFFTAFSAILFPHMLMKSRKNTLRCPCTDSRSDSLHRMFFIFRKCSRAEHGKEKVQSGTS